VTHQLTVAYELAEVVGTGGAVATPIVIADADGAAAVPATVNARPLYEVAVPADTALYRVQPCCSDGEEHWPPGRQWGRTGQTRDLVFVPDCVSVQQMCITERRRVRQCATLCPLPAVPPPLASLCWWSPSAFPPLL
jgi:hypothetical protein